MSQGTSCVTSVTRLVSGVACYKTICKTRGGCGRITTRGGRGKVADLMRQDNVLHGLEPERYPWDRQPGESAKAFDAFVRFRDMGYKRMLRDVALGLHCSGANVRRWAARWFWHN